MAQSFIFVIASDKHLSGKHYMRLDVYKCVRVLARICTRVLL